MPGTLAPAQASDAVLQLDAAATRKTEELLTLLRANIAGATSGSASCTDLPGCRQEWTVAVEQSSASPGVGSLVAVGVVACQDRDANGVCDGSGERVAFDTKVISRP